MIFSETDTLLRLQKGIQAAFINIFIGSTGTVTKWAVASNKLPGAITHEFYHFSKGTPS